MYEIDYHADDYAISMNNSRRMLSLVEAGKLDSFSVVANMSCYEQCMDYLKNKWDSFEKKPLISVHINLIDGISLAGIKDPFLTTKEGYMKASWGSLFIKSFFGGASRAELKKELTAEIKVQIERVHRDLPAGCKLRLDSHVHTHMIPIVFDSMLDAVSELNLTEELEFVRVSKEPFWMFLTTKGIVGTFPMVNMVKNVILNILSGRAIKILNEKKIPNGRLWGLNMSGKMDLKRVNILASKMKAYAKKRDIYLEVLCHPGIVLRQESLPEYGQGDLVEFFSSNRDVEYDAVMNRSEI